MHGDIPTTRRFVTPAIQRDTHGHTGQVKISTTTGCKTTTTSGYRNRTDREIETDTWLWSDKALCTGNGNRI